MTRRPHAALRSLVDGTAPGGLNPADGLAVRNGCQEPCREPCQAPHATEAKVCFKLYRNRCFGAGHMLVDNVVSGFPSHELDEAREAVERLIRDGILRPHPTKHGRAVNIQASLRLHVRERIREHPKFAWLPE